MLKPRFETNAPPLPLLDRVSLWFAAHPWQHPRDGWQTFQEHLKPQLQLYSPPHVDGQGGPTLIFDGPWKILSFARRGRASHPPNYREYYDRWYINGIVKKKKGIHNNNKRSAHTNTDTEDYMYVEYDHAKYNELIWDSFFGHVSLCFECILVFTYASFLPLLPMFGILSRRLALQAFGPSH